MYRENSVTLLLDFVEWTLKVLFLCGLIGPRRHRPGLDIPWWGFIIIVMGVLAVDSIRDNLLVKRLKSFDITARYGNPAVFDTVKKEIWFFKELDSRTCEPYS